jgi:Zn-dependent protease with chaperone function
LTPLLGSADSDRLLPGRTAGERDLDRWRTGRREPARSPFRCLAPLRAVAAAYDRPVAPTLRDRAWMAVAIAVGAGLILGALWYLQLLSPIVDPGFVTVVTIAFLAAGAAGGRAFLRQHQPLDPTRPSTPVLLEMVAELSQRTGVAMPRVGLDDSRLGRAVANVGAVELGPRSESILVTEQLVSDLEAKRFDAPSLRGVILHELGHLALDHSYLRLWTSIGERLIRLGAVIALLNVLLEPGARRVVTREPELALAIALGPFVVAMILGILQRAQETQADAFAVRHAAGRELLAFLHWMSTDLAPILRLERSGVPRDPEQRRELRLGVERLIAEAEAVADEERAEFMRRALERLDEREREQQPGLGSLARWALVARRVVRNLVLAWLGVVPWTRSHPPVEQRLARIAAELGVTAAGGPQPGVAG